MTAFSEKELSRYKRQMIIDNWGEDGQKKLRSATAFIAGAGGLGCPVALFLTVAGIGKIKVCDYGEIEMSNLNRQILYKEWDIGKNKAHSAREALMEINPNVDVIPAEDKITEDNVAELVEGCTIILDCLDNFETRHILNRYAAANGIPFIHAGVEGLSGQLMFIHSPETPCLYCMFPGILPPREIFPVLGAAPGIIGTLQACEAIKWITGIGETLKGRLLVWEGLQMQFEKIEIKKDPDCPVCGQ